MRWLEWFGDDDWRRPAVPVGRQDVWLGVLLVLAEMAMLEVTRSFVDFTGHRPYWVEYLCLAALFPLLVARRRWPLGVGILAFCHFFVTLIWVGEIGNQMNYQLAIFFLLYSSVAWAADRHATAVVMGVMVLVMVVWLSWSFAIGQGLESYHRSVGKGQVGGLLPTLPAWVVFAFVINLLFIGGAITMGQSAWNQARDRARLAEQAGTIQAQAAELRDQAVVDERLRIARELHDVVAHHVSLMGIQAAGARRVLERDPAMAAAALENVEESSREAVTQMRSLLGALRASGETDPGREPQPSLTELGALRAEVRAAGLTVEAPTVANRPGAAAALPRPVQLSLYRTVQEALANVRRHSTARHAAVALRIETDEAGRGWAEAEIIDDGHPIGGTSGSGLGLLGMRERVTSHRGTSEIGPRITGGYRVRVRLPVGDSAASTTTTRSPR